SDFPSLIFKLVGGTAIVGGSITTANPYRHPQFPWLACINANYRGQPGNTGLTLDSNNMVAFDYATITAEFSSLDPLDLGEERIDYTSRVITVPDGTFGYGAGSNRISLRGSESPGLFIPRATFTRARNSLPFIPIGSILALL